MHCPSRTVSGMRWLYQGIERDWNLSGNVCRSLGLAKSR
jgi:hypothetical protein